MNLRNIGFGLLVTAVMSGFTSLVMAATVSLPQTGQSKCYNASGIEISCAGSGQDAEQQIGVKWTTPRFVTGSGTESQCVTDKLTGLMWAKSPGSSKMSWSSAISYANNLVLCGYSDWRLPGINELESLVNLDAESPATWLNTQGFTGVQSSYYWSSTTYSDGSGYAWGVYMDGGYVDYGVKTYSFYVWPVRAGQ